MIAKDLDNYITGHYGEDFFENEEEDYGEGYVKGLEDGINELAALRQRVTELETESNSALQAVAEARDIFEEVLQERNEPVLNIDLGSKIDAWLEAHPEKQA